MALRALARLELVGAGPVAFFEGFHKPADIGVSSLSALQTDAARHPSAVGTGHYPGPSLAIGVIVRHVVRELERPVHRQPRILIGEERNGPAA